MDACETIVWWLHMDCLFSGVVWVTCSRGMGVRNWDHVWLFIRALTSNPFFVVLYKTIVQSSQNLSTDHCFFCRFWRISTYWNVQLRMSLQNSIESDQSTWQVWLQEAFGLSLSLYPLNILVGYRTRLAVPNWCTRKFREKGKCWPSRAVLQAL